jgi:hypothetical protein
MDVEEFDGELFDARLGIRPYWTLLLFWARDTVLREDIYRFSDEVHPEWTVRELCWLLTEFSSNE